MTISGVDTLKAAVTGKSIAGDTLHSGTDARADEAELVDAAFLAVPPDTASCPVALLDTTTRHAGLFADADTACLETDDGRLGVWGDPVSYSLCRDNGVAVLMLTGLLGMWIIGAGGRHFFARLFKDFFFVSRARDALSSVKTGQELRYLFFLIVQTGCLYGLLYGYSSGFFSPSSPVAAIAPWLLGIDVAACLLFLLLKFLSYMFVNRIFYDKPKCEEWRNAYLLLLSIEGVALYPLAFLGVFYSLSESDVFFCFVMLHAIVGILLFYKSFTIFFSKIYGVLHLIVYFCALEIVPIFVMLRILAYVNEIVITKI